MGPPNLLKNRFEKLQRESSVPVEEPVVVELMPVVVELMPVVEKMTIELRASAHPEIHETLRSADKKAYDWKKQFKHLFVKPTIDGTRAIQVTEIEWNIQHLTKNSVLLSFTHSEQLEQSIPALSMHIKKRPIFWSKLLRNAEHLHIYAEKNKIHMGIRYSLSVANVKTDLRLALEEEYLSGLNTIKTFYMKGQNEWIEIILELTNSKEERSAGDANL